MEVAGMGHALDAPHSPVSTHIPHILIPRGQFLDMGGARDKAAAAGGQLAAFHNIVKFFKQSLIKK